MYAYLKTKKGPKHNKMTQTKIENIILNQQSNLSDV